MGQALGLVIAPQESERHACGSASSRRGLAATVFPPVFSVEPCGMLEMYARTAASYIAGGPTVPY